MHTMRVLLLCSAAMTVACKSDGPPAPVASPEPVADENDEPAPVAQVESTLVNATPPAESPEAPEDGGEAIAAVPEPAVLLEPAADPNADAPAAEVPREPRRVLILGDSLAATGFGALLERRLDAHPDVVCYRKGKSASGLARPDFFDWIAEAKRQVEFRKPDLVIVIMGGNDGQDLTTSRGQGRVHWNAEPWAASYRERVDALLQELVSADRRVLWLGLPTMGLRSLENKLVLIRDVQKQAIEALGEQAVYLETAPFVSDDTGQALTHAKVGPAQRTEKIRADDKIHFTMPGSEYFADRVYPEVLSILGVEDVASDTKD